MKQALVGTHVSGVSTSSSIWTQSLGIGSVATQYDSIEEILEAINVNDSQLAKAQAFKGRIEFVLHQDSGETNGQLELPEEVEIFLIWTADNLSGGEHSIATGDQPSLDKALEIILSESEFDWQVVGTARLRVHWQAMVGCGIGSVISYCKYVGRFSYQFPNDLDWVQGTGLSQESFHEAAQVKTYLGIYVRGPNGTIGDSSRLTTYADLWYNILSKNKLRKFGRMR